MGKVSEVEINGHRYRYEYVDGATVYRGPVGSAPEIGEQDFMAVVGEVTPPPEGRTGTGRTYAIKPLDTREIKRVIKGDIARMQEQLILMEEAEDHLKNYIGKDISKRMETSFQKHLDAKYPDTYKVQFDKEYNLPKIKIYERKEGGPPGIWFDYTGTFMTIYLQQPSRYSGKAYGDIGDGRFGMYWSHDGTFSKDSGVGNNVGYWLNKERIEELHRLEPLVGKAVKKYNAGAKSINASNDMLYSEESHGVPHPISSFFEKYRE